MTPIQQMLLGVGAKKKTYMDDVFSTYVYTGTGSAQSINNGIDLAGEGGMTWIKGRSVGTSHIINDTVRGAGNRIYSNSDDESSSGTAFLSAFNSNGFSIGNDNDVSYDDQTFSSWSFRKAPGFFDVVTYTGNPTSGGRQIAHSLGCVPGMIMIKCTSESKDWIVYHRELGNGKALELNTIDSEATSSTYWSDTDPTSTHFTLGTSITVNGDSKDYVAYVFAGGESTAATARSVDFDGTGDYLTTSQSSDYAMGTGDFTVEGWFKRNSGSNFGYFMNNTSGLSGAYGVSIHYYTTYGLAFYASGSKIDTNFHPPDDQWFHLALVRNSGTTSLYYNGELKKAAADNTNYTGERFVVGGYDSSSYVLNGSVSNFRVVKGTAVYTTSFRPPTEPLANITNTKLLCCNNSSVTGTTTGTVTSSGDPTASTDSPFDDPAAFTFGDSKEGIIKCGSYVGNGSSTGPEINLGWEPQWVLLKNASASQGWRLFDSMRGIPTGGSDARLFPNNSDAESAAADYIDLTSTGFKLKDNGSDLNGDGDTLTYVAIRRPDGYVGKPADAGTGVFAMDTGNSSSSIPAMDSNFPVDWAMVTQPGSTADKWSYARLMQNSYMVINGSGTEGYSSAGTFDSNVGFYEGSSYNSNYQSWMWKRHAGFDVVTYTGTSVGPRSIPHSLGRTPGMIMVKRRNNSEDWTVYHSGMGDGNPAINYHMQWNTNAARYDGSSNHYVWGGIAPTSTHFSVGGSANPDRTNNSNSDYLALLFANVSGISKCGHYTGDSSQVVTIETGFQPRFIIMKRTDSTSSWYVLDTTRGWATLAGDNDKLLMLNNDTAQSDYEFGDPVSNGFRLNGNVLGNGDNQKWIYYAHA